MLLKRAEEDKIFQLLSSLGSEYEDLRSYILMNPKLPTFASVCATIQLEEVRKKVMNAGTITNISEARAYFFSSDKKYKGKNPHLKCQHCDATGHVKDRCWILHPELKPDFMKNDKVFQKKSQFSGYKANHDLSSSTRDSEALLNFTSNPTTLINEFAAYLQLKKEVYERDGALKFGDSNPTALLGKFAGFLEDTKNLTQDNMQGILTALKTALNINKLHDLWVIDFGATDHMTNQFSKLHDFKKLPTPSYVSVANGEGAKVLGIRKINLVSDKIESKALYVPSFPFQLLSVGKITHTLNCLVTFSPYNVIFQDCVTKKKIGEGFFLDGLYYLSNEVLFSQGISSQF